MNGPARANPGVIAKLFGALLMAVGGLITMLCGLCSAAVFGMTLMNAIQHPSIYSQGIGMNIALLLVFGGVPIAFGVGVFMWGLALYRGRRAG